MTLDELIARATELRAKHGGTIKVACWPYDGQMLRAGYLENVELTDAVDCPVVVGKFPGYETENQTFLMIQHG